MSELNTIDLYCSILITIVCSKSHRDLKSLRILAVCYDRDKYLDNFKNLFCYSIRVYSNQNILQWWPKV